ncbi:MAG: hypothetical protein WAK18_12365 [Nocardioidaceae bacterium]
MSAPLTVNGTGRVKHLNADRVDGKDAAALTTHASVFRAGHTGDVFDSVSLWPLDIQPGLYNVSIQTILTATPNDPNAPGASLICGVIDLDTFNTPHTRVYLADSTVQIPGPLPAAMSASSTVRIWPSVHPGVICSAPDASVQLFKPVLVSFTNVDHRVVSDAAPIPVAKQSRLRGLVLR